MNTGYYGAESFSPQLQQGESNKIMAKSVTMRELPQVLVIRGAAAEGSAPRGHFTEVVSKGLRTFWW